MKIERLTIHDGKYIRVKGCKSLCPSRERKGANASNCIVRLAAYEDTGLEPEAIAILCDMDNRAKMADLLRLEEYQALGPIDHLRELVEAEREGRCVVLPCAPGDTYYRVETFCDENGELDEPTQHWGSDCAYCCVPCNGIRRVIEYRFAGIRHIIDLQEYIGKTVFLTRAEAEGALGGGRDGHTDAN